ncbi:hypothetical protein IT774_05160 [Salinimonas marina]|uniref:Uncharacterized protein n=1 Tax=Salinimonas marina TaxID=2785918 RepID=A0A7S9DZ24_9ALTE|nr:hypothetical protein [Salinimonas marina]QPG06563.1 hypothetical protein IT774_05160 [Salinimonas marina]
MAFNFRVIFGGDASKLSGEAKKAESSLDKLGASAKRAAGFLAAAYGGQQAAAKLVDVTKRYQKLEAQLLTATGTMERQQAAFAVLTDYAKATGQDVGDVTTAFTRLVNLGLNPSKEALTAYGNVAAATGKSTIDFVEAVADAATGEFERLKEFGIKSSAEGDKVTFTFRGVKTTIQNDAAAIESYLQAMGQNEFGNAMANQAKTLEAQINRTAISWDQFWYSISDAGVGEAITSSLGAAQVALDELTAMISSGEIQQELSAWVSQFDYVADAWIQALDFITEYTGMFTDAISDSSSEWTQSIIDAFRYLPTNIKTFIELATVEFASLIDVGAAVGGAIVKVVAVKLAQLVEKTKIWSKEMASAMVFWSDEEYNADAAYKAADQAAQQMTDAYFKAAEDQIAASRQARMATITDIMDARDVKLEAYEQESAKAEELRQKWESVQAARKQFDLGDAGVKKDPAANAGGSGPKVTESNVEQLRSALRTEREQILAHHNELSILNQGAYDQKLIAEEEYQRNKQLITNSYNDQIRQLEAAQTMGTLNNYGMLFGGLADMAKTFGGEQSTAFKAMFAVSKAFSIASSIIAIQNGISQAISLGFPQNIPVIATTVAQGASVMSTLRGTNFQGQAHDGIRQIPGSNEGTWMLKRGETVLNPKQADNFEYMVDYAKGAGNAQNAGTTQVTIQNKITIDARGASEGTEQSISDVMDAATQRMRLELADDFANGGPLYRQLNNRGMAA